jgi:protein-S-isoprenylcysteine O-methyltransferase Ste14
VNQRELQHSMYERRGSSIAQRVTLAVSAGACVLLAWWILGDDGLGVLGSWLGWAWRPGDPTRRILLTVAFSIYYVRLLFTEFVFLKRGVGWNEVLTVAPWLLMIVVLLAIAGGTNGNPVGGAAGAGCVLFVLGSWMNSYAEYTRDTWKQRAENRGQLYTSGLFRFSRHPNYLGDLVSFSGLCMVSGAWVTVIIPVLMLAGFLFVNIPVLDAHLRDHYGDAFDEYAQRTRKLIPFVY